MCRYEKLNLFVITLSSVSFCNMNFFYRSAEKPHVGYTLQGKHKFLLSTSGSFFEFENIPSVLGAFLLGKVLLVTSVADP
jgi:hypothetical protein